MLKVYIMGPDGYAKELHELYSWDSMVEYVHLVLFATDDWASIVKPATGEKWEACFPTVLGFEIRQTEYAGQEALF